MNTASEIRQSFLDFFSSRHHFEIPGSSLIPGDDPSLLFTNAGMVQFKDVFLGREASKHPRVVTVQPCVRVGGKHNDLENVGYTSRHHTFFEMLGNFSFGDYFKEQAIDLAWEYLTEILCIDPARLWVTVYEDDDDAANIWLAKRGVSKDRFRRCGDEDNFWTMGEVGPCGPCSEIYYDHGACFPGKPPSEGDGGERYVEIWNLVFTQFERDQKGNVTPIPHPSVDTGMGLERIAAVMQGVHSNYDTDLFRPLISATRALLDGEGEGEGEGDMHSLQVVADHLRSSAFLIAEGVNPGNEGRAYVLRRIIRRAVRYGYKLGLHEPFLHRLLDDLLNVMGECYPRLRESKAHVARTLLQEEERFAQTLEQGLKLIRKLIEDAKGKKVLAGEEIFRLYDTYGFPADLSADIAREHGMSIDEAGFTEAMTRQRTRARQTSRFDSGMSMGGDPSVASEFSGYDRLEQNSMVLELYQDGNRVNSLVEGETGGVILLETPFYAQAGGQIGDRGELFGNGVFFDVEDTRKQGQAHIHLGVLCKGTLKVKDVIMARVDELRRTRIARNHSATHLLHAALRAQLGEQVQQKGSLVADGHLRFDFSWDDSLNAEQLADLEDSINRCILQNTKIVVEDMELEDARESGALMLFGEKYAERVRVLSIGESYSKELCGGTHVKRCGDIGLFRILSESGVANGVRRIEAVTGDAALEWGRKESQCLKRMERMLKTNRQHLESKLAQNLEKTRQLDKEVERLRGRLSKAESSDLASMAMAVGDLKVLAQHIEGADAKTLRTTIDALKQQLGGSSVVVLGSVTGDSKVNLAVGVGRECTDRLQAGVLINHIALQVGGRGGGRPDMAQAGGNKPEALPDALNKVPELVRHLLNIS
ncbi:MAG: alanine--tRNA ligase [Candidatus Eutrophobiaceae bacterium]